MSDAETLEEAHREFHATHMHIRLGDQRCPVCRAWRQAALRGGKADA